ncbi:unnamed protein product [Zymoseptoria tritici ST99CH_3D1]|nr:unnamed protein product [Zymoseptoria tritici ST99CH_3D1]
MLIEIKGRGHRCNHSCSLANTSVTNFIVVEYNGYIGSRLVATDFGENHYGDPYRVELGANWVHGRGGNILNPINLLLQKHNDATVLPDYENYLTYNETGEIEIDLWDAYDEADKVATAEAGRLLTDNVRDQSTRAGLALAGWNPEVDDMSAALVEWINFDWSIAVPHDYSSLIFNTAVENFTYGLLGDEEPFIVDSRGYNTIVSGEAFTFLQPNDPRLLLNTIVTDISHSDSGVTVHNADGTCISAAYAINTSSLGVLKHDSVSYTPALPTWKSTAIQNFGMTTYTKIFLQFPTTFWPQDTELFYHADPHERGNYPVFQSLSHAAYLGVDSNILFATAAAEQSHRIERQTDANPSRDHGLPRRDVPQHHHSRTHGFSLSALDAESGIPGELLVLAARRDDPRAPERTRDCREDVLRGREMGERVAGLLGRECLGSAGEPDDEACGELRHFELVDGDTPEEDLVTENRWPVESVAMESFGA